MKALAKKPRLTAKERARMGKIFAKLEKKYRTTTCPSCKKAAAEMLKLKKKIMAY